MAMLSNLDLIRRVPLFSLLTNEQGQSIADSVVKRRYRRGEIIVEHGRKSNALFILLTGRARVLTSDSRGREVILAVLQPGDYVGEMSLIDNEPHSATVRAEVQTDMLVLGRAEFARCLPENSSLSYAILRGLVQRLRNADRQIESLALLDVYGRVARSLLDMAEQNGDQLLIRNKVSRQDMAKIVGASREMVSRVMKDLEERGVIQTQENGSVVIKERLPRRLTRRHSPSRGRGHNPAHDISARILASRGGLFRGPADAGTYTRSPRKRKALAPQPRALARATGHRARRVVWLLALLAMASHNAADPAGRPAAANRSLATGPARRRMVFRSCVFLVRFFCLVVGLISLRSWLGSLARLLRRRSRHAPTRSAGGRYGCSGLDLCCCLPRVARSSTRGCTTGSRDYRVHAGGVLGYLIAPLSMKALGFAGSGVLWIAALLVGLSLSLSFSWLAVAERIGARIEGLRVLRQERIERAEDAASASARCASASMCSRPNARSRSSRRRSSSSPRSAGSRNRKRVIKERQKLLFSELSDTKLPQVDLLDAAPGRWRRSRPNRSR